MVYVGILLTVEPPGIELTYIKLNVKRHFRELFCSACQIHAKYKDVPTHKNKPYQG